MHCKIENKTFPKLSFEGEQASTHTHTHSSCACSTIFENFQLHNSIKEHTHKHTQANQACIYRRIGNVNIYAHLFGILNCNSHHYRVQCSVSVKSFCCRFLLSRYFVIFIVNFCVVALQPSRFAVYMCVLFFIRSLCAIYEFIIQFDLVYSIQINYTSSILSLSRLLFLVTIFHQTGSRSYTERPSSHSNDYQLSIRILRANRFQFR